MEGARRRPVKSFATCNMMDCDFASYNIISMQFQHNLLFAKMLNPTIIADYVDRTII